jgi:hypothetical protein|tara:strand:- start:15583 stop:17520 length:1938 start_codon:yes stop_codon:yes gene_type:complete
MAKKNVSKDVKYLNKDFSGFRDGLIEFSKTYFPNTYNDFNESDPGMMFIEMASYVGDTLSYYMDEQFKESMLAFAEEKKTIYEMAQGYGYKPRQSSPATVTLDVYQTVPARTDIEDSDGRRPPNEDYCVNITAGMKVTSQNGTLFRTVDDVVFGDSSSMSPREESIAEIDDEQNISKWLLKKSAKAVSGNITTEYITFGAAEKYKRISLAQFPVLEILSVTDGDGNSWYQVPFLAQDTVYSDFQNNSKNSPDLVEGRNFAPFLLKLIKTSKRYKTYIRPDGKTEIRFGSGVSSTSDEEIIPNPSSVGSSLPGTPSFLDTNFDPANFLNTATYGQCPTNTTLTIKYSYGGGLEDNTTSNTIINITEKTAVVDSSASLNASLKTQTLNSIAVLNVNPATGGGGAETLEDVRTNALAYFQAQGRAVTKDDFITRVYSLPAKYGNVAKVFMMQDEQVAAAGQNEADPEFQSNPLALNMYMLGYDGNKKLVKLNNAVKENIQTYLSQYRMMTDAIQLKDAWVCNIGLDFAIYTKRGFNKHEVLLMCVKRLKEYFHIDKWQINQPIILADVVSEILSVDGVATAVKPREDSPELIQVNNKWGTVNSVVYSDNIYDIASSTFNGVVYPPVDPATFEIKYPDTDIRGRVMGDI